MPTANHSTSKHIKYASVKDFGWQIQSLITGFLQDDRRSIALRLKADGKRTSQIASYIYGEATKNNMNKVDQLLKEVA